MPNLLKREVAPLSDKAWELLDGEAAATIRQRLTARKFVDLNGPHGWELAAVNLGRLRLHETDAPGGVPWGIRESLPIIETRIPFKLDMMEIDDADRGSKDVNLDPLHDAATRAAGFEDSAVYNGFAEGHVKGILQSSQFEPVALGDDPADLAAATAEAVKAIAASGVSGPYLLVLNADRYVALASARAQGYPARRLVSQTVENVISTPVISGGLVVSAARDAFELTVGQDFSLGYRASDTKEVELYITEAFTFRVLDPRAAIELRPA
jgi:uncharacterized linocin/CFP29 family protein